MLYCGSDGVGARQIAALKPPNPGNSDLRAEIGVFSCPLHHTAPARVAGDIRHGRKRPVQPLSGRLGRRDPRAFFNQFKVPARGLTQRNRKAGLVPMHDIEPEDERDTKSRIVDGIVLHDPDFLDADNIQHRSDHAGLHQLHVATARFIVWQGPGRVTDIRQLDELADFLFQRHLRQQALHTRLYRRRLFSHCRTCICKRPNQYRRAQ